MASSKADSSKIPIYKEMRGFLAKDGIFSADSKLLFLYSLKNVYIYSVETAECICSLKGHKTDIVSLIIHPLNNFQIISLDKHGIINIWDYLRCKCVNTINLSSLIIKFENINAINNNNFNYSSLIGSNNNKHIYCIINNQHIISMNITNQTIKPIICNVSTKHEKESFSNICLSIDGMYLSAIMNKEIIIIKTDNLNLISFQTKGWNLSKTLSFHPNNNLLAFGDARGGIHLWNDFMSVFKNKLQIKTIKQWINDTNNQNKTSNNKKNRNNKYLISKIHWHSHEVSAIKFTTDGAYMLSGGEESVLVLTQLETQRQQFLPRLGGEITFISVSNDEIKFAIGLNTNCIHIIDSINNKIIKSIAGIGICSQMKPINNNCNKNCIINYPKDKNIFIMPSVPGTIQFYDLNNNKSKGILNLIKYPILSRIQNKYFDRYNTQFIKFNCDGTRLITVIKRTTNSILGLNYNNKNNNNINETENLVHLIILQIWHYDSNKDIFILNTRIDSPHQTNLIRGIVIHPTKNRFLTFAENDNNFHIWEECFVTKNLKPNVNKINNIDKAIHFNSKKHITWKSLMTGYYNKDYVSDAQFSYDGTILFIAAGFNLTLWNSNNLMLLKKIDQLSVVSSIQNFKYLPYLLTVNSNGNEEENDDVIIWDLVRFKKHWSVGYELGIDIIFDVVIIPFKNTIKQASDSLFLIVCTLKNTMEIEKECKNKYLVLCDMENKEIINKWVLPKDIKITNNSMIVQVHNMNKKIIAMFDENKESIDEKDIDVIFLSNKGPVKIQCLYNQLKRDTIIVNENENNKQTDIVSKYLNKLSGNDSVFEKIFGTKQLQSKPVSKEELEREKQLTKERLLKLKPSTFKKLNVVEEMFAGPAHTLPPMDEIWDQYMAYFVEPINTNEMELLKEEKEKNEINQRRIGNTNIILNEINEMKDEQMNNNNCLVNDKDVVMDGNNNNENDNDSTSDVGEFELTESDMKHWKSLVMDKPNINLEFEKFENMRNGCDDECNGVLLSFLDWRDELNDCQTNSNGFDNKINGSYD